MNTNADRSYIRPSAHEYRYLGQWNNKVNLEQRGAAASLRGEFQRLDTAAGFGNSNGLVGVPDLKAARSMDSVRWAANHALEAPYSFLKMDTATGTAPDGLISHADLLAAEREPMTLEQASESLRQDFGRIDNAAGHAPGPDGLFSKADLEAAIFSPYTPAQTREAVLTVLGSGAFGIMENAVGEADPDGLVGMADLFAFEQGLRDAAASDETYIMVV